MAGNLRRVRWRGVQPTTLQRDREDRETLLFPPPHLQPVSSSGQLLRLLRSDLNWSKLVWTNLIWFDLIWSDLIWSDLNWPDLVWSDQVQICSLYSDSYQHPAGWQKHLQTQQIKHHSVCIFTPERFKFSYILDWTSDQCASWSYWILWRSVVYIQQEMRTADFDCWLFLTLNSEMW